MRTVLHIAYYELRHILKTPVLCLIVFLVPAMYALFFSAVYCHGVITDIPLGIVDLDHSQLSRELGEAFKNDPYFKAVSAIDSYEKLDAGMKNGKIRAGIVIPENFSRQITTGRRPEVLGIYDASNLIWGLNIRKNALQVISDFNNFYTADYLAGLGMNKREALRVVSAVDCNLVTWYNPTNSYVNYIIMGLMLILLQQLGLMSAGLSVTREKENNTWLQFTTAVVPWSRIVMGKCLPYLLANFLNYIIVITIAVQIAGAKMEGNLALLLVLGLIYDAAITFLGFVISLLARESLRVTRYLLIISMPLFMISGYSWPAAYVPELFNIIARIFPSTWMINAGRIITVKGLGWGYLSTTFLATGIMAVGCLVVALAFPYLKNKITMSFSGTN